MIFSLNLHIVTVVEQLLATPHVATETSGKINGREWMKMYTGHFEVAVRVRLNLETLILILKTQSAVFRSK